MKPNTSIAKVTFGFLLFIGALFLLTLLFVAGHAGYRAICTENLSTVEYNGAGDRKSSPSRFYVNSCNDTVYYKHNSLGGMRADTSLSPTEAEALSQVYARDADELYLNSKKVEIEAPLLPLVPTLELVHCSAVSKTFFLAEGAIYSISNPRLNPKLIENTDVEAHRKCGFIE